MGSSVVVINLKNVLYVRSVLLVSGRLVDLFTVTSKVEGLIAYSCCNVSPACVVLFLYRTSELEGRNFFQVRGSQFLLNASVRFPVALDNGIG